MRIPRLRYLALLFLVIGLIKIISLDVFFLEGWVEEKGPETLDVMAFKSKIDIESWEPAAVRDPYWKDKDDLSPSLLEHRRDLWSQSTPEGTIGQDDTKEEGVFVVTGGLGNIGMALIKELLSRGIRVRCFDILPKAQVGDRLRRFDLPASSKLFEYVEGDIRNRDQVEALLKQVTIVEKGADLFPSNSGEIPDAPILAKKDEEEKKEEPAASQDNEKEHRNTLIVRGVFHLAGVSRKTECSKAPIFCESVNVGGTKNIIEAIKANAASPSLTPHREHPPWLVYVSSHEVFGDVENAAEDEERMPKNDYGRTKMLAEKLIQDARDSRCSNNGLEDVVELVARRNAKAEGGKENDGIDSAILRFGTVYGSLQAEIGNKLVPQIVREAINGLPLTVVGPRQRMDFLHMRDAIDSLILAGKLLNQRRRDREMVDQVTEKLPVAQPPPTQVQKEEASAAVVEGTEGNEDSQQQQQQQQADKEEIDDGELKANSDVQFLASEPDSQSDDATIEEFHPRNYWRQNCDFDFNIGSGTSSDMRELVTNVLRLVQSQSQINLVPGNDEKLLSYTSVSILKAKEILEFSPKIPLNRGLDLYLDSIEKATLIYLQRQRNIYCVAQKDRIGTFYQNYTMENIGEKLLDRVLTVKESGACEGVFDEMNVAGFISMDSNEPICKNNDGSRKIIGRNFCLDMANALAFARRTHTPHRWWIKQKCGTDNPSDLPVCEYDCEHPTTCVQTGRCQCVDYGRCNYNGASVVPLSVAVEESKAQQPNLTENSLLPFIMTPLGREAPGYYPVLHMLPFKTQATDRKCKDLQRFTYNESCFTATARIIEGMQAISVPRERGDLFAVPYYQRCSSNVERHTRLSEKYIAKSSTSEGRERKLVYIMVHDWSKCLHGDDFNWSVTALRKAKHDAPNAAFKNTHVFLTNGDSNTNCFDPKNDIVIPPQTCLTNELMQTPLSALPKIEDRTVKIFLAGSTYGTGKMLRQRLACSEIYKDTSSVRLEKQPVQDYLPAVANSRFCLCPRGVAGWAPRLIDAIYLGCIPVLISDYTIYPFQDLIDYSRFAVFVRESEVPLMEDIIDAISPETEREMRVALGIVRDSLLYFGSPLREHSPVDLALQSLYLMRTRKNNSTIVWA